MKGRGEVLPLIVLLVLGIALLIGKPTMELLSRVSEILVLFGTGPR